VPLGKDDPVIQLGHAIAGRGRCLVVLDNFEQVLEHSGGTLGVWAKRAREACFVVTSRERLQIQGEEVMELQPLPVKGAGVKLFARRARAQRPDFAVNESNRSTVEKIVALLDGLPLSIELAAARVRILSPSQVLERMSDRFRMLASTKSPTPRQATLKAAIDSSWDLLTPWEKSALAQCSVFEGGFTLEAAEAVVDMSDYPEAPWSLDVVQSLVDKSLLRTWTAPVQQVRHPAGEPRFGMYVSIQEYATEELRTERKPPEGTDRNTTERGAFERHGEYYARFGSEETIDALDTHGGVARRKALNMELDNLIAACRRAVARGDSVVSTATFSAAWAVLMLEGPLGPAVELGREVMAMERHEPVARGRLQLTMGLALDSIGQRAEAQEKYEAALGIFRTVGSRSHEGRVLGRLGNLHWAMGRKEEAREHWEAALAIHREAGDRSSEGGVLSNLGNVHMHQGRKEEAQGHYEAALAIHREVGNRRFEGITLSCLGTLHADQGRWEEGREHYEAALAVHREAGNRVAEGVPLSNLGRLLCRQGRWEEGRERLEAALAIHREAGNRPWEGFVLGYLGNLHANQGRWEEAGEHLQEGLAVSREVSERDDERYFLTSLGLLRMKQGHMEEARDHLEAALAITREMGNRAWEGECLGNLGLLSAKEGNVGDARDDMSQGENLLREVADLPRLGNFLCRKAECEHLAGDTSIACRELAEAETIAEQLGAGPDSELGREITKLRQILEGEAAPREE
ncbi:tetratricopeptide repeat protein, partial [Acidobacteriota bacterium]